MCQIQIVKHWILQKLNNNMMCIILKKLIVNTRNKINNSRVTQSFLFSFILNSLDINIPDDATHIVKLMFSIFILSLICLLNFINVVGYLTSIYLINKYDIETKFPKFKKVIRFYEKSSLFWVILEGFICVIFLLIIIIFCLMEIRNFL